MRDSDAVERVPSIVLLVDRDPVTTNGVRQVDRTFLRPAWALRMGRWDTARTILLRVALPQIVTGLRVGVFLTLHGALTGEMFRSQQGVGLSTKSHQFQRPQKCGYFGRFLRSTSGFAFQPPPEMGTSLAVTISTTGVMPMVALT